MCTCIHGGSCLQNKNMFLVNLLPAESFYCTSAYSSCYRNKPLAGKKYFSLHITVLFMQSNASDVDWFCVEQGICSAGLRPAPEPGHGNGTGVGMGGHSPSGWLFPSAVSSKASEGQRLSPGFWVQGFCIHHTFLLARWKGCPVFLYP